jgi:large subunit ribosomal protein L30
MADAQLVVKQVRSAIGAKPKHRGTLRALGLGRIGRSNVLPDRPEIRGMVARVTHLVEVSEATAGAGLTAPSTRRSSTRRRTTK